LPNQDDEAAEVVVVVDQDLSVRAADTNTNSLGAEEVTLSNFIGASARIRATRETSIRSGPRGFIDGSGAPPVQAGR
jgi:hypothetical protein